MSKYMHQQRLSALEDQVKLPLSHFKHNPNRPNPVLCNTRLVIDDPDNSGEDIFVIVSLLRPVSEGAFLYPSRRRSPGGNDDAGGDAEAEGKDEEGEEIDWQRPLHRELIVSRLSPQEGALEEGLEGSYYALLPAPLGNATLTLWYLPAHLSFGEPLERLEVTAYKVQVRAEAIYSPKP